MKNRADSVGCTSYIIIVSRDDFERAASMVARSRIIIGICIVERRKNKFARRRLGSLADPS